MTSINSSLPVCVLVLVTLFCLNIHPRAITYVAHLFYLSQEDRVNVHPDIQEGKVTGCGPWTRNHQHKRIIIIHSFLLKQQL
jgi:hypothetical protein